MRELNDKTGDPATAAGDYRITFSFDSTCGSNIEEAIVNLNTFFENGITQILVPEEEEIETAILTEESESTEGGATPVIYYFKNPEDPNDTTYLTYIDVRILERSSDGDGGGRGNGGEGGQGGGGSGGGGGKNKK